MLCLIQKNPTEVVALDLEGGDLAVIDEAV